MMFAAASGFAQDTNADGYVTVLLPIATSVPDQAVTGAEGSSWRMELGVQNNSRTPYISFQPSYCIFPPCPGVQIPSGFTGRYPAFIDTGTINRTSALLQLLASDASAIHLSARLYEDTGANQPAGVDLPVIREDHFLKGPVTLLGVPVGPTLRSTLRVYDPRLTEGSAVRVTFTAPDGHTLASWRLAASDDVVAFGQPKLLPHYPGYAQIYDLTGVFPQLQTVPYFHVNVAPDIPGMEYWAFVSVTESKTQHVTLITPQ